MIQNQSYLFSSSLAFVLACAGACAQTADQSPVEEPAGGSTSASAPVATTVASPAAPDDVTTAESKPEATTVAVETTSFAAAMQACSSGQIAAPTSTTPYGCSVKYAEGQTPATSPELSKPAPEFSLQDLNGNTVSLQQYRGKTVVLEWFNPGCPFVVYAHEQGPLKTMAGEAQQQGVVWLAINSGAAGKQGNALSENQDAAKKWGMNHPILLDPTGSVGRSYGAKTTPHMFVIDPQGNLVYSGALDNAPLGRAAK